MTGKEIHARTTRHHHLVTGQYPVPADSLTELMDKHALGARPGLRKHRPDLPTAFVQVIALLDDQAVSLDGTSVYDVAYEIVWSCLVEDSNLFFKYFMEKLTRDVPESTFQILRALIR